MITAERFQHVKGGGKPRPYIAQTYTNLETALGPCYVWPRSGGSGSCKACPRPNRMSFCNDYSLPDLDGACLYPYGAYKGEAPL